MKIEEKEKLMLSEFSTRALEIFLKKHENNPVVPGSAIRYIREILKFRQNADSTQEVDAWEPDPLLN